LEVLLASFCLQGAGVSPRVLLRLVCLFFVVEVQFQHETGNQFLWGYSEEMDSELQEVRGCVMHLLVCMCLLVRTQ
jgi:hypothetical protein